MHPHPPDAGEGGEVTSLAERMGRASRVSRGDICDLVPVYTMDDVGLTAVEMDIDHNKSKVTLAVSTEKIARAAEVAIAEVASIKAGHEKMLASLSREVDAARAACSAAIEDARAARRALDPDRQQRDIAAAVESATVALQLEASTMRSQMTSMRDELNNLRAQKRAWRKAK